MRLNSIYQKGSLFFILLFPILFIKQCEKNVTNFITELDYYPCSESDVNIPGANFSTNCFDGFSKVPNFELINHNGDTITNQILAGKNYILHFFFTSCPVVCRKNISKISDYIYAEDRYGNKPFSEEEITILSISIDHDSIEDLRRYMTNFRDIDTGVQKRIDTLSNWQFLTGERAYVRQFANNMSLLVENNFRSEDEEHFGYAHSEYVLLIDKKGFLRKNIDNVLWSAQTHNDMKILSQDIKALILAQSSQEYEGIKISKKSIETFNYHQNNPVNNED
tara:strand:- start:1013 stop:1849 length:837 start_codon:yes stop_codon:yes gene_type:complete